MMDINSYQDWTNTTALYHNAVKDVVEMPATSLPSIMLLYLSNTINEEAGEIAGKAKRIIRDEAGVITEQKAISMVEELGDLLYYMAQMAQVLGYTMQEVMDINVNKLLDRKVRGVIKGSGDNR